jgi:hypothetical protein
LAVVRGRLGLRPESRALLWPKRSCVSPAGVARWRPFGLNAGTPPDGPRSFAARMDTKLHRAPNLRFLSGGSHAGVSRQSGGSGAGPLET